MSFQSALFELGKQIRANPQNPRHPRAIVRTRMTRIRLIYTNWFILKHNPLSLHLQNIDFLHFER